LTASRRIPSAQRITIGGHEVEEAKQQQQTSQPPDKTVGPVRPEAQRRRPPIRVTCDCCGPAQEKF